MVDQEGDLPDDETLSRAVTINYYGTEDALGIFADQAIVSHSTGLFTLFFFQMQFPPTPTPEDLRKIESLPARCVARVILTPTLMEQFAEAINGNLARYKKLAERKAIQQEKTTGESKEN
jgi:hypothetical protein